MNLIINTTVIVMIILWLMHIKREPLQYINPLNGRQDYYSKILIIGFALVLIFVAAFRRGFVDTGTYKSLYTQVGTDYNNAFNETIPIDNGFSLFMIFLNRINPDPQFFVIVTSIIIFTIDIYVLTKYSYNTPFTFFLFFVNSYLGALNGIRQVMAAAILSLALTFVLNRKPLPYIILVLLLSTFHASILVMIPIYFIISGKCMNIGVLIFAFAITLCFVMPDRAYSLMGKILEDSAYVEYLDNESKMGFMRFLVALVPAIMAFIYYWYAKKNRYIGERLTDVLVNMEVVCFGFTVLGMKMVYFARISMYFAYVTPLLLPLIIDRCFAAKTAKQIKFCAIVLYLALFAYQVYTYDFYGYLHSFELIF